MTSARIVFVTVVLAITRESNGLNLPHSIDATLGLAQPYANVCTDGKQVPDLWLLGAQKAATTFAFDALSVAGVKTYCRTGDARFIGEKECSPFMWYTGMNESLGFQQATYMRSLPACPAEPHMMMDAFPGHMYAVPIPSGKRCAGICGTLNDFSMPKVVRRLCGDEATCRKLTFVISLREPLQRMHSAWYHAKVVNYTPLYTPCFNCVADNFRDALANTIKRAIGTPPVVDDWLWVSMYAEHLKAWTAEFDARQFVIVPYRAWMGGDAHEVCDTIATRTGSGGPILNCSAFSTFVGAYMSTSINGHDHPGLDSDLPPAVADAIRALVFQERQQRLVLDSNATDGKFFHSLNIQLAGVLHQMLAHGASFAGLRPGSGSMSPEALLEWLKSGW